MAVHVNRNVDSLLQFADQLKRSIWPQQSRHIFDRDGMRSHILQPAAHIHPQLHRVHRAYGIADGRLRVLANINRCLDRRFQVS